MQLKEIKFNTQDDVYSLVRKLKKKKILSVGNNGKITSINAHQFLIADDGNTYILDDILSLTNEEAESLALHFLGNDGEKYSISNIRSQSTEIKLPLIQNKLLVDSLVSANFPTPSKPDKKGKGKKIQKLLNISTEECPISHENFIFPVIANSGHNFEKYALTFWLLSHDKNPLTNLPLTNKDVVPNHALEDLIWVNFYQRQAYKAFLIKRLAKEKNETDKERYQVTIERLEDEKKVMVNHLESQIDALRSKKREINSQIPVTPFREEAYQEAIKNFPSLKQMTKKQLTDRQKTIEASIASPQAKVKLFEKFRYYKTDSFVFYGAAIGLFVFLGVFSGLGVVPVVGIGIAASVVTFFVSRYIRRHLEAKYIKEYTPLKKELDAINDVLKAKAERKLGKRPPECDLINQEIKAINFHLKQIESKESLKNAYLVQTSSEAKENKKETSTSKVIQKHFEGPTSSSGFLLNRPTKNYKTTSKDEDQEEKPSFKI